MVDFDRIRITAGTNHFLTSFELGQVFPHPKSFSNSAALALGIQLMSLSSFMDEVNNHWCCYIHKHINVRYAFQLM